MFLRHLYQYRCRRTFDVGSKLEWQCAIWAADHCQDREIELDAWYSRTDLSRLYISRLAAIVWILEAFYGMVDSLIRLAVIANYCINHAQ